MRSAVSVPRPSSRSSTGRNLGSSPRRSVATALGRSCCASSSSSTTRNTRRWKRLKTRRSVRRCRAMPEMLGQKCVPARSGLAGSPGVTGYSMKKPACAGWMYPSMKKPACAGFFAEPETSGSGDLEGLDAGVDAALVTGSLVLVDQAACGETIEDRHGSLVGGFGSSDVVGLNGLENALNGGTQHGAMAGIARVADQGLLGALLGGFDVGHDGFLNVRRMKLERKTRNYGRFNGLSQSRSPVGRLAGDKA